jgi:parallel beta-helix repeat protein
MFLGMRQFLLRLEIALARHFVRVFFIMVLTLPLLTPHASTTSIAAELDVTKVSGIIFEDTTWLGTMLVTEKVTVAEGVTLTVEPGTVVKFEHWRPGYTEPFRRIQLIIEGTLLAVGTLEKLIRFTSDALEPEHSDWTGINFGPSSRGSVIDYSIVEFAKGCGIGVYYANITLSNSIVRWCQGANVWLDHSTAIITHNRIYGAGHGGIEMAYSNPTISYNTIWNNGLGIVPISTSTPTIDHNVIMDNRFLGVLIMGRSSPLIEYNNITGNTHEGIKIQTSNATVRYNNIYNNGVPQLLLEYQGDITATNNWWGTADREQVKSSIQVREGSISYEPYLTSPEDIGEVKYDYENNEIYDHPPATENDIFPYFYPSDETRKIANYWSTINNPSGIAWDGEYFWVVNLDKKLLKYDPLGRLVDSLTAPGSLPIALAYDGQYLWTRDFSEQRAYQFDFSGRVIRSILAPVGGYGEGGLVYDGHYLWTGQGNKLYKFDTAGNIVEVIQIQMDWILVSGLAWDGEHLWAVDKEINEKILEIDPSSGSILRWINSPGDETWGMTWADGYLWACEWTNDWNNYLIVKMEPLTPIITRPAEFIVTDLDVSPVEAKINQTITISVNVTNIGENKGSYNVDLNVAGIMVDTRTVTLSGGESATVIFDLAKEEVGAFDVEVSGLKGTFVIKKISTSISCSVSPSAATMGDSITASGTISPALLGKNVTLIYKRPNGSTFNRTVTTGSDGSYSDSFKPDADGAWSVIASWDGDSAYHGTSSLSKAFTVKERAFIETPIGLITLFGGIMAITIVTVFIITRKRKSPR